MQGHIKFPKIGGLHNVIKSVAHWASLAETDCPTLQYRAKLKLHGTNMGIRVYPDGSLIAQSRNQDIEVDGYQFPQFVEENAAFFARLAKPSSEIVVFGEWAGPGIQKKVSVCAIPDKSFFVFAISAGRGEDRQLITEPEDISRILSDTGLPLPERLFVIPWFDEAFQIDFQDRDELKRQSDGFNETVAEIDAMDPYIKDLFGLEGRGEGLVYYPLAYSDRDGFGRYAFKVKGAGHMPKGAGGEKKARVSTPISEDVKAYVEMMVTPARVEQGQVELFGAGPYENSGLGPLIKWVANDVQTEGKDELEASDLAWKDVMKLLPKRVREIYFDWS